jgi:hypothetical protein
MYYFCWWECILNCGCIQGAGQIQWPDPCLRPCSRRIVVCWETSWMYVWCTPGLCTMDIAISPVWIAQILCHCEFCTMHQVTNRTITPMHAHPVQVHLVVHVKCWKIVQNHVCSETQDHCWCELTVKIVWEALTKEAPFSCFQILCNFSLNHLDYNIGCSP